MKSGHVYVIKNEDEKFELKSIKKTGSKRIKAEEISDIKFNPNGDKVAIGSHDNRIYIYKVANYLKKKACKPLAKHSSYITHIDWSMDGESLHSNCGAYEILFWDTTSGVQNPSGASALRDEEWHTWTATIGFQV